MIPPLLIALMFVGTIAAGVVWGLHLRRGQGREAQTAAELERVRVKHQKLLEARRALERLEEKQVLDSNLAKSQSQMSVMSQHNERFGAMLVAIEQRLAFAEPQVAEDILITFAKHLRHILHEGCMPFVSVSESIEHMRTYIKLMGMLTSHRFDCFLDPSADEPDIQDRYIESLLLTPWLEQWVWPMFELAERHPSPLPSMMISLRHDKREITMSVHRPTAKESKPWTQLTIPLLGSRAEVA